MKNVIKNSKKGILMVSMFATMLSFANEEVPFYSIKNEANRTALTLNNVKEGNLLTIKDNNGIVLYKELIQKSGSYTKGFDLTALPNGSYIFELDKDVEINTIPFNVVSNDVLFNKALEKTIYKPFTKIKGDVAFLTRLSLNEEPLKVDIYFNNSEESTTELIYSETITNTVNINRVFKLTGLHSGAYKFVYNTDGRVFTKEIHN
ncbi:hypothetical protein ACFQ0I_02565 [Mariniflexile aquimaris]|uniref:Secreted protein (Por secretion system target) n=1 Tax=Mariniflexile aquimaris TaxID=881009 RepID=A0ABW3BPH0_9FLAO